MRFFQTDGHGAPVFGAALVKSDAPVGVAAFVTASDAQGAFAWETSVYGPPPFPVQSISVDVTQQTDAAVTLYRLDAVNVNHLWSTAFAGAHQDEIGGGGAGGPVFAITGWTFPAGQARSTRPRPTRAG